MRLRRLLAAGRLDFRPENAHVIVGNSRDCAIRPILSGRYHFETT
jgi:hypothetical protein